MFHSWIVSLKLTGVIWNIINSAVPEWSKGDDCKPEIRQFKSDQHFNLVVKLFCCSFTAKKILLHRKQALKKFVSDNELDLGEDKDF